MKKKLYQDELEGFLSDSAEDLRMYPSARVWRNIDTKLHGEKKWPALTFAAFLTGALTLAGLIFMQPDKDLFKPKPIAVTTAKMAIAKIIPAEKFAITQNPFHAVAQSGEVANANTNQHQVFMDETDLATAESIIAGELLEDASVNETKELNNSNKSGETTSIGIVQDDWKELSIQHGITSTDNGNLYGNNNVGVAMQLGVTPATANRIAETFPLQMDDAANAPSIAALKTKQPSKWSVQYYATPSLSYRMLSEEKQIDNLALSTGSAPGNNYNSLGAMVNHKPKIGIEAGVAVMYNVTDNFRVKAGLQMNYRQYAIDAYSTNNPQPALIRIDQGNNRFDTIFATTGVSNVGAQQDAMQVTNHYFQIGVPVGFELSMANFKSAQFVLAATFQPTYNIGQQAWLISTDYQSYVKQPDLMRKWNFNTGIEAFLRFSNKSGNLNWQVGPQIRYQLLPGAVNKYPVREHLIDYGLKIGVSKTLK